jgi:NADH-quinone oxidoreductase subunit A
MGLYANIGQCYDLANSKGWDSVDLLMVQQYFPILVFIILGALFGLIPLALGATLGPRRPNPSKVAPYECGFDAFEDARQKFDVRYYLIAILFIIFDLEIVFLFPWAVTLDKLGLVGFLAMAIFLSLLVVGFIFEWRKGALEWE